MEINKIFYVKNSIEGSLNFQRSKEQMYHAGIIFVQLVRAASKTFRLKYYERWKKSQTQLFRARNRKL